ncbi:hypothetical protein [Flavobacterium hibisci]|uniref:hypothetical protein n=1 Tax=Flavobacterium hibisci TaxID=1914462 RepID=UPI001CBD3C1C|nr:hypothetical protein [Flavobacterium hibisci]MBZ4042587.1 hypothetical protein [Flavobacterium hibisci]
MKIKRILSKKEVCQIKQRYKIRIGHFVINKKGLIDVNGDVYICNTTLKMLPLFFGKVYGDFYCSANKLSTLKGCPEYVGGSFNCNSNNLTTLKGGPKFVGGDYFCQENDLTSLKHCPSAINGSLTAFLNRINTFRYLPEKISGNFYANNNELTSIEGSLKQVGGSLHLTANALSSLAGCPTYIGDTLSFDDDVKLDIGNQNCIVKKVNIQKQESTAPNQRTIPPIVIEKQMALPIIFKYYRHIGSLYSDDNSRFNLDEFNRLVLDIEEGFR